MVRFCKSDLGAPIHFQVIFSSKGEPIRVDTNADSREGKAMAALLADTMDTNTHGVFHEDGKIKFEGFYSPMEARFPLTIMGYMGMSFLDIDAKINPFKYKPYDLSNYNFVNVPDYIRSNEYKFNSYQDWRARGQVNGIRGNWNKSSESWDKPELEAEMHSLQDYGLVDGLPKEVKQMILSDHKSYTVPFGVSTTFADQFYNDLESGEVVVVSTHAGTIDDNVQIAWGIDVWSRLGSLDHKFGTGRMRHLILEGCSTTDAFKGGLTNPDGSMRFQSLFDEWMPAEYVAGLQTVCGVDGVSVGGSLGGSYFFGRYNKGDSIWDSWGLSTLDSDPRNNPVEIAYGKTIEEAAKILADGRFSTERVTPTYAVSADWRNLRE